MYFLLEIIWKIEDFIEDLGLGKFIGIVLGVFILIGLSLILIFREKEPEKQNVHQTVIEHRAENESPQGSQHIREQLKYTEEEKKNLEKITEEQLNQGAEYFDGQKTSNEILDMTKFADPQEVNEFNGGVDLD